MRILFAVILFLLTLLVFVYIADEMVLEHETAFDQRAEVVVASYQSPEGTRLMEFFTFFGSSAFLFPAYAAIILLFVIKKKWRIASNIAAIGLTSTGILFLMKEIFKRHRPPDPLIRNVTGFSFPSGHSFSAFTFFGIIIYILWQTSIPKVWKIISSVILFLLAATVAYSRVYLRVHFPSDVIAGFCLSVVWLILAFTILQKKKHEEFET